MDCGSGRVEEPVDSECLLSQASSRFETETSQSGVGLYITITVNYGQEGNKAGTPNRPRGASPVSQMHEGREITGRP